MGKEFLEKKVVVSAKLHIEQYEKLTYLVIRNNTNINKFIGELINKRIQEEIF